MTEVKSPIPLPGQAQPKYSIEQLQNYLQLTAVLLGESPKTIGVSREVIDWYKKISDQVAKNFNIPVGKGNDKVEFMGVELVEYGDKEKE